MMKFKIYTLGCKVNQYDSGDLCRKLIAEGFELAERNADVAIINTCSVTKTAIHKDKRMINKARNDNPRAKIVVMGCWPSVYGNKVVDTELVWGVGKLDELVGQIFNFQFSIFKQYSNSNNKFSKLQHGSRITDHGSQKSRYFLKIQDGCEQFCTYCVIPYARGKLSSRPVKDIIKEVKAATAAGHKEIVLCGIHLGRYGRISKLKTQNSKIIIEPGKTLDILVKKIIKLPDLGRVRLSSIEVNEVTEELIGLMAKSDKICKHLHIPLQAGGNKILKLMNRPYDTKYFQDKVKRIRKLIPDIAITTDVMVGFPGESEKDFKETCDFVKATNFSRLHVFPFSAHEKAPASKFSGQVDRDVIKRRTDQLKKLGVTLEKKYIATFKGQELLAVVENKKNSKIVAKTEYYFDITLNRKNIIDADSSGINIGQLLKIKI